MAASRFAMRSAYQFRQPWLTFVQPTTGFHVVSIHSMVEFVAMISNLHGNVRGPSCRR